MNPLTLCEGNYGLIIETPCLEGGGVLFIEGTYYEKDYHWVYADFLHIVHF